MPGFVCFLIILPSIILSSIILRFLVSAPFIEHIQPNEPNKPK